MLRHINILAGCPLARRASTSAITAAKKKIQSSPCRSFSSTTTAASSNSSDDGSPLGFCSVLSDEQSELQQLARKFTANEITPKVGYKCAVILDGKKEWKGVSDQNHPVFVLGSVPWPHGRISLGNSQKTPRNWVDESAYSYWIWRVGTAHSWLVRRRRRNVREE